PRPEQRLEQVGDLLPLRGEDLDPRNHARAHPGQLDVLPPPRGQIAPAHAALHARREHEDADLEVRLRAVGELQDLLIAKNRPLLPSLPALVAHRHGPDSIGPSRPEGALRPCRWGAEDPSLDRAQLSTLWTHRSASAGGSLPLPAQGRLAIPAPREAQLVET